jgi:hypothetical protein
VASLVARIGTIFSEPDLERGAFTDRDDRDDG